MTTELRDEDRMPFGLHEGKYMDEVPTRWLNDYWNTSGRFDHTSPVARWIRRKMFSLQARKPDLIWETEVYPTVKATEPAQEVQHDQGR